MTDISTLSVTDLESLLEEYPWFTLARKEYVRRQGGMGTEALKSAAAEAGIFLLSRADFADELSGRRRKAVRSAVKPAPEPAKTPEAAKVEENTAASEEKRFFVVGGDYFDKADYKELEASGDSFDTSALAFNPIASALGAMEQDVKVPESSRPAPEIPEEDCMFTETLAKIYYEQEFYQRAIEVYEKLILLYPKKSAYFATLIEQAKNIKQ